MKGSCDWQKNTCVKHHSSFYSGSFADFPTNFPHKKRTTAAKFESFSCRCTHCPSLWTGMLQTVRKNGSLSSKCNARRLFTAPFHRVTAKPSNACDRHLDNEQCFALFPFPTVLFRLMVERSLVRTWRLPHHTAFLSFCIVFPLHFPPHSQRALTYSDIQTMHCITTRRSTIDHHFSITPNDDTVVVDASSCAIITSKVHVSLSKVRCKQREFWVERCLDEGRLYLSKGPLRSPSFDDAFSKK